MSFGEAVAAWHDFYVMLGGASAALTGLLFVALSINLKQIKESKRIDLQAFVTQTFFYFLYVLLFSALFLIPDLAPRGLGIPLLVMGLIGLVSLIGRLVQMVRRPIEEWRQRVFVLFILPTIAFVGLVLVAIAILNAQTDALYWMVAVMLTLIALATGNTYRILVDMYEV